MSYAAEQVAQQEQAEAMREFALWQAANAIQEFYPAISPRVNGEPETTRPERT